MAELKKCPFCGGEAELIEYIETVDGRGDKIARVRCKCGCEIHLTMREFSQAEDDFGYKGGYYSQNTKFWNGMHQRLVDKWNNRATEAEIRAMAIDEFAKEIEAEYDNDACPNVTDYLDYKISLRDLFRIAEQLKEE